MPSLKPISFQSNYFSNSISSENSLPISSQSYFSILQNKQKQNTNNYSYQKSTFASSCSEELQKNVLLNNNPYENASKKQWQDQEDQLVYQLHNKYGNKWAIIAEHLKGRTDNCVKNHFYSRLRKGLRKINKSIQQSFKKNFKEFKTIDLYKIIQASDQKFKEVKSFTNEMTDLGLDLKNRLFTFAEEEQEETEQSKKKILQLVEDMSQFTKNYKRKSKKSRRYSPMGIDSIYRANAKKTHQAEPLELIQAERSELESQSKSIKNLKNNTNWISQIKSEIKQKKNVESNIEIRQTVAMSLIEKDFPIFLRKQSLIENQNDQSSKNKNKNKDYRNFSDDEDEDKNQAQYLRQQRLNHFAQNLLKTFKSYYSFRSFKSNSIIQDPFFD